MCGIVGYVGRANATPILIEGLQRLEYRGYDSAGIAVIRGSAIAQFKSAGKVSEVVAKLPARIKGSVGIGHTRWATHGEPNDINAHPHIAADGEQNPRVAIVHNGIIENAPSLRANLEGRGVVLASQTDSELLAHLILAELDAEASLIEATRRALALVTGTYGLLVLDREAPQELVVACNGSPVILGVAANAMYVASDVAALVHYTQQVVYMADGEVARITKDGYEVTNLDAVPTQHELSSIQAQAGHYDKGSFEHYTLKEITEQPQCIQRALSGRLDRRLHTARLDGLNLDARSLLQIRRIKLIGCGSAYISATIGATMIEQLARIPCDAEPAAEFRYRNPIIEQDTLYFAVSQSGETYDTLAAVEEITRKGGTVLGVVNVVGSSIARACSGGVYLHSGPEIAVVSTKTFANTLVVFSLIALYLGRLRDLSPSEGQKLIAALDALPEQLTQLIENQDEYRQLAEKYAVFDHAYFIGRNEGYGLAMEGALKLKELSYIHAEAYPASELKHGPLALVSPTTPTVAIIPEDSLQVKNYGSLQEISARQGPILAITQGQVSVPQASDVVVVPSAHTLTTPLLMLIPMQFLAYYAAIIRDCNVDQPRNLAKSVTVE